MNRDVSPSNVRLSYDGDVKLLDFGIAQALMKFTSEIGILKGKFSYMSPEQIRGMPLDARTDVFSTGIIFHEMLTTEKLFRGDTEFALMERVRKAEVPPPSTFNRRVTPELDAIVARALARDVADRYQSAAQLAADLDALIAGYRFDPKELRQFMRQLFRKEYAQELEEQELALGTGKASDGRITMTGRPQTQPSFPAVGGASSPGSFGSPGSSGSPGSGRSPLGEPAMTAQGHTTGQIARPTPTGYPAPGGSTPPPGAPGNPAAVAPTPPAGHPMQTMPPPGADPGGDKPRGFFSSLFKKKK